MPGTPRAADRDVILDGDGRTFTERPSGRTCPRRGGSSRVKQIWVMSLDEAVANVAVGQGVPVVTRIPISPTFALCTALAQNPKMSAMSTAAPRDGGAVPVFRETGAIPGSRRDTASQKEPNSVPSATIAESATMGIRTATTKMSP
jgi:hypothetical protein